MSTPADPIADRTILVTGANRGIGRALVEEALRRGAKRVYAGTRQPLHHVDPRVATLSLDVTDAAQIHAVARRVDDLDVLVNNAGLAVNDDLGDRAVLERHLAVNLFGPYAVTQALLPQLIRSHGAVVNVLSVAALAPVPVIPPTPSPRLPRSPSPSPCAPSSPPGASAYTASWPARSTPR